MRSSIVILLLGILCASAINQATARNAIRDPGVEIATAGQQIFNADGCQITIYDERIERDAEAIKQEERSVASVYNKDGLGIGIADEPADDTQVASRIRIRIRISFFPFRITIRIEF